LISDLTAAIRDKIVRGNDKMFSCTGRDFSNRAILHLIALVQLTPPVVFLKLVKNCTFVSLVLLEQRKGRNPEFYGVL
jgi:hypothetical protein